MNDELQLLADRLEELALSMEETAHIMRNMGGQHPVIRLLGSELLGASKRAYDWQDTVLEERKYGRGCEA